jgi:hypothetical protein
LEKPAALKTTAQSTSNILVPIRLHGVTPNKTVLMRCHAQQDCTCVVSHPVRPHLHGVIAGKTMLVWCGTWQDSTYMVSHPARPYSCDDAPGKAMLVWCHTRQDSSLTVYCDEDFESYPLKYYSPISFCLQKFPYQNPVCISFSPLETHAHPTITSLP